MKTYSYSTNAETGKIEAASIESAVEQVRASYPDATRIHVRNVANSAEVFDL